MSANTILVTSIGTGQYEEVQYRIGDRAWPTKFAPVATARLLSLTGARALVLVTHAAEQKWYHELARELTEAGLQPEPVSIAEARDEEGILSIFSALQGRIPARARVVLDVTFTLRHLPFVYLSSLAYLVGLREVGVDGIYYGAYELPAEDNTRPIIEVTPLFQLLQWYHALASARESGSWSGVARMLRSDVARLFRRGMRDEQLSRIQTRSDTLAAALASGLPLECGIAARNLVCLLAEIQGAGAAVPGAQPALNALAQEANSWLIAAEAKTKADITLSETELQRQIGLARWYADHGDVPKALSVLREWVINAAILASGNPRDWLNFGTRRKPTEQLLNAIDYRQRAGLASETERAVGSLWRRVADWRNEIQHAGLTEKKINLSLDKLRALIDECERCLPPLLPAALGRSAEARLLITPLGFSPGVVYSGVMHVQPTHLLVVTSADAAARLSEALDHTGRRALLSTTRKLQDPHAGFDEIDPQNDRELRCLLAHASEVVVNVTGGTTAMQYAAERLANEGRSLGVPVRRVMLIDRRSPEEQRTNPYVLGEIVWLDREEPARSPAGDPGEEI